MQRDMDDEHRPRRRPGTILGRALAVALAALVVGPVGIASAAEEAPVVTTQPVSQVVTEPESATFTAAASGTPTPTVQWEYAEVAEFFIDLPGATSTTLTISSTTVSQSGFKYRARFTNAGGTKESKSNFATLTVNVKPVVTTQPVSQEVTEFGTATFTAAASGTPTPTIQWWVLPTGGVTWAEVPGAISGTLSVENATSSKSGYAYRAVFTNGSGSVPSSPATLTVNSPPQVKIPPSNETVLVGQNARFTAAASGTPTPTVQWQVSANEGATFSNVAGATSGTLTVKHTTLVESGNSYRAVFTNKAGIATSSAATLTVESMPTVSANPSDQTVLAGENAVFSAAAGGSPPPTVRWEVSKNNGASFEPLAGATSATLTIKNAGISDGGHKFRAVFTNPAGTETSEPATLTVHAPPAITGNPANATVLEGGATTFTAAATGTPTPTVQWQVSANGGPWATDNTDSGNTTGTLTVANSTVAQNGNRYRAVFTNMVNSATSEPATLTVHAPPVVTTNPESTIVEAGQPATFTAAASGTPPPTVQWQVSMNGSTWEDDTTDSGSTTGTLTIASTSIAQSGNQYRAVFSNGVNTATSKPAKLTVNTLPVVTMQPESRAVLTTEKTTFTAAASGRPTPTVQWERSTGFPAHFSPDTSDAGNKTGTLTVTASSVAQNGYQYRAAFTNSVGTVPSAAATLTVAEKPEEPVVTSQPINQRVLTGQNATFSAAASGIPTPTVQWEVSKNNGASFEPGATNNKETLIVAATMKQDKYQYRAVFTNSAGKKTSAPATLTVEDPPKVKVQPVSKEVPAGVATTFTAAASGTPTPTIQWWVLSTGGVTWAEVPGATSGTLTIPSTEVTQNGYEYLAVFTSTAGTAESSAATLTLLAAPVVTISPVSTGVTAGESATFTAAASGAPSPTVQWQVSANGGPWTDDTADSGNATDTLTVGNASLAQNGNQYRAVFTNMIKTVINTAVSTPAALSVVARVVHVNPVASFTWFPSAPHTGESVSLASNSTGGDSPVTAAAWDLAGNGPFSPGASVVTTSFATPGSHTVRLRVTDGFGLSSVATRSILVSTTPLVLMQPFPVVRIAGSGSPFGVTLSLVSVQAPVGARITVTCRGRGCPARSVSLIALASKHKRRGPAAVVAFRRFERTLPAGVTMEIRVTKPGQIGKYTGFTVRQGKLPVRVDMCINPSGSKPTVCPSQ